MNIIIRVAKNNFNKGMAELFPPPFAAKQKQGFAVTDGIIR